MNTFAFELAELVCNHAAHTSKLDMLKALDEWRGHAERWVNEERDEANAYLGNRETS